MTNPDDLRIREIASMMVRPAAAKVEAMWLRIADLCIEEYRTCANSDNLYERNLAMSFLVSAKTIWPLTGGTEATFYKHYGLPDDLGPAQQKAALALASLLFPLFPPPPKNPPMNYVVDAAIDESNSQSAAQMRDTMSRCETQDGRLLVGSGHPLFQYACLWDKPTFVKITLEKDKEDCPRFKLECFHPDQQPIPEGSGHKSASSSPWTVKQYPGPDHKIEFSGVIQRF